MKKQSTGSQTRPRWWRTIVITLLASVMTAGCQSPRQAFDVLASEHGRDVTVLSTSPYPLVFSAPKALTAPSRLRIYIEGDGHAWATPSQPSLDPTPRTLLVANLAFDDPTPNIYLARPCQFQMTAGCDTKTWTTERFSRPAVTSLSQALDQIKARYGNDDFELIGYSGGAALALLLAAERSDVSAVQTLAGNVTPRIWARALGLTPMPDALDPIDVASRLRRIPQRHLIGAEDTVAPGDLVRAFTLRLGRSACASVVKVPRADHSNGWHEAWRIWQSKPIDCPR